MKSATEKDDQTDEAHTANHQRSVETLEESASRYRRLLKNLPEIVYSFSNKAGGLYYSPRVENVLGYSPEHLSEHPLLWHDSIHPDDLPMVDKAIADLQSGKNFDLQYRIRDANGSWHWFHDRNMVIQGESGEFTVDGLATDITDHIQAVEEARTSEARLHTIVMRSPIPMVLVDQDGNIEHFNTKFVEKFGWTTDDVHTSDEWWGAAYPDPLYRKEVQDGWEAAVAVAHKTGAEIKPQNWRLTCKNGDVCDVEFQMMPLGEVSVIAMVDLTERIRTEQELIRHRDHLEELVAQRTSEVEMKATQLKAALESEKEYNILQQKFVSLVSHEFRTPLAIIDGTAQRLIRCKDKLDVDEIETRASTVRSAVTRMIDLIDTTLFIAHLDSGKVELKLSPLNIGELIRDVCDRQAEISTSHEIQVKIDDLPREIIVDQSRIDQVFTNLLSNAVKYAPDDPLIKVKGWVNGSDTFVSVTDQGVGIPEDELPQMFDRYFRAKTAEGIKGTGIGLSVVKEIVEMHGGTITVASVEGEGSTFTIRLPIDVKAREFRSGESTG